MKKKQILKKHVGRPVDFLGLNRHEGIVCHGRIVAVRNGIARLADCIFPGDGSGYDVTIETDSPRIVEVY